MQSPEQEGRNSSGWFSAWYQPRQRRRGLRKAWDFPKAGAAESLGGLEEMPGRVRVRCRRKTGIGKCPRAQAPPGKLLWGVNVLITLHMNQQKSPESAPRSTSTHIQPLTPIQPHPNSYLGPPRAPRSLTGPHQPHPGPLPTPPTDPEAPKLKGPRLSAPIPATLNKEYLFCFVQCKCKKISGV